MYLSSHKLRVGMHFDPSEMRVPSTRKIVARVRSAFAFWVFGGLAIDWAPCQRALGELLAFALERERERVRERETFSAFYMLGTRKD